MLVRVDISTQFRVHSESKGVIKDVVIKDVSVFITPFRFAMNATLCWYATIRVGSRKYILSQRYKTI